MKTKEKELFEKSTGEKLVKILDTNVFGNTKENEIYFIFFVTDFEVFNEIHQNLINGYVLNINSIEDNLYSCRLSYYLTEEFEKTLSEIYLEEIKFG
ncbi:hypothetical protein [Capnocytophaga catalasegens]|uniref:Uncharacterized protein n=1 Tax=Capnocytophaga catalasegens TaxID=1004260 RepID=A0AAV5ASE3_9FLAO|nr:hypothetical protein [Capnocytophaga catalasegens]GIZ15054.1 hypothetical protein RCZ03_10540 [Capnocytophaga catalasegens]GJM49434.1 hypothetical protein RCZ15_04090 [Capnocytophaga catalasegens]GJM52584.1 hypothetical protein RCZ16_09010 [Capnocytophaga catalasegens]